MKPEHERYISEHMGRKTSEEISRDLNLKERKVRKFLEKQKGKESQNKPHHEAVPTDKRLTLISIILIICLGICAYGNSIKGDFLFDDESLVTDNRHITSWSYLPDVFKEDLGAGAGKEWNSYRPLQVVTYMLDYSLWKLDPRGYHLTNITLHILTALCLFWLISILFGNQWLALLTGLFFVVHPIHTQAVSYIAGRADSLSATFMLISFALYVKQGAKKNNGLYALMLSSYVLAIFSRESGLFFPLFIPVYHYALKKKIHIKEYISLACIMAGYMVSRAVFFSHLMPETSMHRTTLFARIPGVFVALAKYAQLLVWPMGLHMEYGEKLFKMANPLAIAGAVILVLMIGAIIRSRQKSPVILFALIWFLVTLFPTSNLYPLSTYMAEHWLYLPSMGIFLLVAKGLCVLYENKNYLIAVMIIGSSLLCFYSFLTFRQNIEYWREPFSFYERTIKYAPDSFNAYINLGKLYRERGETEKAIPLFEKAIEINPRAAYAYNNLAAVSYKPGVNEEYIIELFKKATKYDPYHASARYNLGKLYADTGKREKAIPEFKKAVELDPNYIEAYDKLGTIYGHMGRWDEAIAMFRKSIAIDSSFAVGHTNLAVAYLQAGQVGLAVEHSNKARALGFQVSPDFLRQLESAQTSISK